MLFSFHLQTGSGKTFTVTGGVERYSERGVIPRTLSYLFQQFQKVSGAKTYRFHVRIILLQLHVYTMVLGTANPPSTRAKFYVLP